MKKDVLPSILACPRCKGEVVITTQVECTACGATFPIREGIPRMSDGAETRDERMAAEWNAQAQACPYYGDRSVIMNRWEEQVLPRLLDWLGPVTGVVLDVGCGVGHLGNVFATSRHPDVELVGTDFQPELLRQAEAGYAGLVEADVHHLPFKSNSIGAAIASNSLHHFPDVRTAMSEIARVLRPGGVFVAYDPRFVAPLEGVKKLLRRNDRAFTKDHKAFRVDEYRELIGSSGLAVTDLRLVDPLGPLIATGLDYLKIGRLGLAVPVAKALTALDDIIVGRSGNTTFGLMLAGRAVKR